MTEAESLTLLERVRYFRAWASSRIDICRREELKFMRAARQHRDIPQIEAWSERRALLAALNVLGLVEINPQHLTWLAMRMVEDALGGVV